MKRLVSVFILMLIVQGASAQYNPKKFGKGINIVGKDSTFTMRFGIRFPVVRCCMYVSQIFPTDINHLHLRMEDPGGCIGHSSSGFYQT